MGGKTGIRTSDIRQGKLGDSWYLSVLTSLADKPKRVKKLFENNSYPASGAFKVNFFDKAEKVSVVVDDLLPMKSTDDMTAMGSLVSEDRAWWVAIAEKAYAKFNTNYANIDGGSIAQAMRDLTGMPVYRYYPQKMSAKDIMSKIRNAQKKGWILSA